MNNRWPALLKRMMPVPTCCWRRGDCFCPLSSRAMSSGVMTDIFPPNLSELTVNNMHADIERTHLFILNLGESVRLLLLRFWSIRKQTVDQRVVVLTKHRHKTLNHRIGTMICR